MKIASIDIETTGTDKTLDQILSIGIVLEDTKNVLPLDKLPQIEIIVIRQRLQGNVFALGMNRDLISEIKKFNSLSLEPLRFDRAKAVHEGKWFIHEGMVSFWISEFLLQNGYEIKDGQVHINCLGKNFGTFDKLFLEELPSWGKYLKIRQRILDPAPLNVDWENDDSLPNLKTCMERCNFPSDRVVTHNAVQDALDTLEVLRISTNYYNS